MEAARRTRWRKTATARQRRRPGRGGPVLRPAAHLLDAVEDQAEDDARGAFNPLTATGTAPDEARRLCEDAAHGLALRDVEFTERHLVETLFNTEVQRAINRTFTEMEQTAGRPCDDRCYCRHADSSCSTCGDC
ncbi:hypothetical protein [Nonomuraea sp. 10N515B]|uniref:hypothetical protein n=1 Tax=Nonomuraea sp. 10N515B TaxID=3457422 RepID=UPI003FCC4465